MNSWIYSCVNMNFTDMLQLFIKYETVYLQQNKHLCISFLEETIYTTFTIFVEIWIHREISLVVRGKTNLNDEIGANTSRPGYKCLIPFNTRKCFLRTPLIIEFCWASELRGVIWSVHSHLLCVGSLVFINIHAAVASCWKLSRFCLY